MYRLESALKRMAPDIAVACYYYHKVHGRPPNLVKPKRFSEKVLHRKLFDRNPLYSEYSDKYKVRSHIARSIDEKALVPLVLVTAEPNELLAMERWANKVLKPNHGAMMVEIVPAAEPDQEEKHRIVEQCRTWLRTDFSKQATEPHYGKIERRILVEEFIGDRDAPLVECKIHCFPQHDGSIEIMCQLICDRFGTKAMSFYLGGVTPSHRVRTIRENPPSVETLDRDLLAQAVEFSKILSKDFTYVRVDWLMPPNRLYFSELTFTPGAGLSTSFGPDLDQKLAGLWVL
jgi:hypothetical protein